MPITATAASAPGVKRASGRLQAAPGSSSTRAAAWMPAAIDSGDMRWVARFIQVVEMP